MMGQSEATMIEVFEYPSSPEISLPEWDGAIVAFSERNDGMKSAPRHVSVASRGSEKCQRDPFEQQVAEAAERDFEAGRQKGVEEGRAVEREMQESAQAEGEMRRSERSLELVDQFIQERDRFLHAVEHEVVELSLAVAARILRREAQMDPLLLTGAVRVALGQLSNSTKVRLRVPPPEFELWTEAMAHLPNLALRPVVLADEGMRLGDCIVETELGSVDLGVRAQLGEIERGFFDRATGSGIEPAAKRQHSEEQEILP